MSEIGGSGLGSSELAGALFRDPPTVTVTAPSGPQATETVTVTWTYSSAVSKTQYSYRVQILNQYGSAVLYDSGVLLGADVSFACPFVLSGGSTYQAKVIVSDGVDSGSHAVEFSSSLDELGSYTPSTDVGSVYEVAINGTGYRLADSPERPYRRQAGQLQAPRLAVGDTPFSEAIERYSFLGTGDWSLGAGQKVGNREGTDVRAFFESENVNPFEEGLTLLPATSELMATASGAVGAVIASGHLFCATASDTVKRMTTPVATPDTMTFTGDTLVDLASDGTYWYAVNTDEEIFRGTGTTIGAAWSTLSGVTTDIDMIEWCSDRLGVVYVNGSGQSVLSTLAPDGTEEVAGGRFKYTDATIVALTAGDGYLWFAVNRTDRSVVRGWQLGSADAPTIAFELPKGEYVTELFFYLGNVMVRAATPTGAVIYRAIPQSGELTPERVLELDGTDTASGAFTALDKYVLFGWKAMSDDGRSGVGAIDLSTGGWCRWLQAAAAGDTGAVVDGFAWLGKVGFLVDGSGPQYTSSTLSATGYLMSSVYDMGSSLTKVFDSLSIVLDPLPANSSVDLDYSLDSLNSFVDLGAVSAPGVKEGSWNIERQSTNIAVKITLAATGATSPKVRMIQTKLHALSVVDAVVELPISCSDRQSGLNGVEILDDTTGLARARLLESLVGTRVLFQDVDYPLTGVTEVWEMVSTEFSSVGIFERSSGARQEASAVCVCTLRRAK